MLVYLKNLMVASWLPEVTTNFIGTCLLFFFLIWPGTWANINLWIIWAIVALVALIIIDTKVMFVYNEMLYVQYLPWFKPFAINLFPLFLQPVILMLQINTVLLWREVCHWLSVMWESFLMCLEGKEGRLTELSFDQKGSHSWNSSQVFFNPSIKSTELSSSPLFDFLKCIFPYEIWSTQK